MEIIKNCSNNKLFLKTFGKQLEYTQISTDLVRFSIIDECPDEIKVKLREYEVIDNKNIMILNPQNTNYIKNQITKHSDYYASKLGLVIQDIKSKISNNYTSLNHNIICHIMLSYLWQKIWDKKANNKYGGNIFIVENFEDCPLLYTKFVPIRKGVTVLYVRSSIQKNNQALDTCLNENRMVKMLQTMDNNKILLPTSSRELQLITLNLVKMIRRKEDFVGSYVFKGPEIKLNVIQSIRDELKNASRIGNEYLNIIKDICELNYKSYVSQFGITNIDNIYQAYKYVANYCVTEGLIIRGYLNDFVDVKGLTGLGPMSMVSIGIS